MHSQMPGVCPWGGMLKFRIDRRIKHILDINGLDQLITEPTRITLNSCSFTDLCITNSPLKIAKCGVVQFSISDTALIYMTHKAHYERTGTRIIKTCQMKNFNYVKFLRDLQQKPWSNNETLNDPNDMWLAWKGMLMAFIDKHAPLKSKQVGNKKSPCLTNCVMKCTKETS